MIFTETILSERVLVLNRLWQPVNICGLKRALCLLYKGAVHVVSRDNGAFNTYDFRHWIVNSGDEEGGNLYIRGVSIRIRIPEIILLLHYDRLPLQEIKLTRKNVYLRDKNTCQYCGRTLRESELNLDHILPRRLGGSTTWTNIACSCVECNLKKGERTLEETGMRLIRVPKKPRWSPFNHIAFRKGTYTSWEHFLSPSGWKVQISDELDRA
jgi:5-methylcytosine-specific restriction endonuclease McrA